MEKCHSNYFLQPSYYFVCLCSRDHGPREDRQKTRMMWLVEQVGMDKWQALLEQYLGEKLQPAIYVRQTT